MNKEKNHTKAYFILLLFTLGLFQQQQSFAQLDATVNKEQSIKGKKYRKHQGGLDFSVIHLNYHQAFAVSDRIMLGFEGGLGVNFLSFFVAAGDHFATDYTLFAYDGADEYGDEFYAELLTLQLFARIRTKEKKDLVDIGYQIAPFLHLDGSDDDFGGGTFRGVYVKSFLVLENKKTGTKRFGIGAQLSAGQYYESESINQFGIRCSFWIRYYFKRGVGKRNY